MVDNTTIETWVPREDGIEEEETQEVRDHFLRACESGHPGTVRDMMEENLIPDILENMNCKWNEPLKVACQYGHLEIVMYLLSHGRWEYDVSKRTDTLLHIASVYGHVPIVKYLLANGHKTYINTIDSCRRTPLHCACKKGKLELVRLLIENGANLEVRGPGDTTPLSYACHHGHLDIVKFLQDQGADLFGRTKCHNKTSLHWACIGNADNVQMVEYLLQHGADANEQNRAGFSPLHLAVSNRHANIVLTLLRYGAHVNETNGIGMHAIDTINPYCVQDKDSYNADTSQTLVTLLLAGSILPNVRKSYIPPMIKLLCIWAGTYDTTTVQQCLMESLAKRDVSAAKFLLEANPRVWSVTIHCENFMTYNQTPAEIEEALEILSSLKRQMPTLKVCTAAAIRKYLFNRGRNCSILQKLKLLTSHLPRRLVDTLSLTHMVMEIYPKLNFNVI